MKLEKGLRKYKNLPRKEYFEKNQEISKNLWEKENTPTVGDIADFVNGKENEKMNAIFDYFDNKEDFSKMIMRIDHNYDQDESSNFIKKVMSSNNEDISKAGYFYKLLMASADDFLISENNCKSLGVKYLIKDLTKEIFDYHIKSMYINEFKKFILLEFDEFLELCKEKEIIEINVRTPLSCNLVEEHKLCRQCAGVLPKDMVNVGTFTTLMVTEHATQSALSSMNKGIKENINELITSKYTGGYNYEEIKKWIEEVIQKLENDNVESRFYEIALLSRVREDEEGPFVSSLKSSINHSGNIFGSYIFTSNMKNFEKIIYKKQFDDNSLKLKIAMNCYKD